MEKQEYNNHFKMAPRAYYLGLLLALIVLIFSSIYREDIVNAWNGGLLSVLFAALCVAIVFIGYFARAFALKAQDRAIRAEENLRHFVLTGKLLDSRLSISQIIALRFATDDEFVSLSNRAAEEQLTNKQIKQAIKSWKGDFYRV